MNIPRMLLAIAITLVLFLPGEVPGSGVQQQADRKAVFEEIGQFNDGGMAVTVLVSANLAYVCDKLQGLEILDITDPSLPKLLGTFKGGGSTVGVCLIDDYALVINWEQGLEAIDVRDPSNPVRIGSFFDGGRPNGL